MNRIGTVTRCSCNRQLSECCFDSWIIMGSQFLDGVGSILTMTTIYTGAGLKMEISPRYQRDAVLVSRCSHGIAPSSLLSGRRGRTELLARGEAPARRAAGLEPR